MLQDKLNPPIEIVKHFRWGVCAINGGEGFRVALGRQLQLPLEAALPQKSSDRIEPSGREVHVELMGATLIGMTGHFHQ
jgi:hypothetical protein